MLAPSQQRWSEHESDRTVLAATRTRRRAQFTVSSAYAKRHGLAVSTLYYWQSKLKASALTGEVSSPAAKFVALRVVDAALSPRPHHCTLVLPAGMRLEMTALPAPEWLVALGHAAQGAR